MKSTIVCVVAFSFILLIIFGAYSVCKHEDDSRILVAFSFILLIIFGAYSVCKHEDDSRILKTKTELAKPAPYPVLKDTDIAIIHGKIYNMNNGEKVTITGLDPGKYTVNFMDDSTFIILPAKKYK